MGQVVILHSFFSLQPSCTVAYRFGRALCLGRGSSLRRRGKRASRYAWQQRWIDRRQFAVDIQNALHIHNHTKPSSTVRLLHKQNPACLYPTLCIYMSAVSTTVTKQLTTLIIVPESCTLGAPSNYDVVLQSRICGYDQATRGRTA